MVVEILIGLLVIVTIAGLGAFIGLVNAQKAMTGMRLTNNGLHERLIESEADIEDAQHRSDILKEKLSRVEVLIGNTQIPIKTLRTQIITEIKK
ncbi:hypothetical protein BN79_022 [Yersinia phage phiR2-01]|uniref:Uncharacterized protein n=1 Tax=Yersinia phage phiR2-01 TaxID=1206557 RepID=I7KQS2_9CAUD|nr:hypothetical protein BN79_022 [Yersinia phage phiR2-01]CCI88450.1 hypothetical protein BN79_022 [Yersinia phage phiR2-01]